ncbi:hypothetical protein [Thermogymnomonas acidicola]|uniref:hypothetical protein n=1 Tax=Thermogymnomonas acidicola TaxID=399579 RepID=UPI001494184D|nr:hypothetical protein [Thermogymnomonas acidicola]
MKVDGSTDYATSTFYYGQPPNYDWIYYVVAVVAVVMIVVATSRRRPPQTPGGRPKWKR